MDDDLGHPPVQLLARVDQVLAETGQFVDIPEMTERSLLAAPIVHSTELSNFIL